MTEPGVVLRVSLAAAEVPRDDQRALRLAAGTRPLLPGPVPLELVTVSAHADQRKIGTAYAAHADPAYAPEREDYHLGRDVVRDYRGPGTRQPVTKYHPYGVVSRPHISVVCI